MRKTFTAIAVLTLALNCTAYAKHHRSSIRQAVDGNGSIAVPYCYGGPNWCGPMGGGAGERPKTDPHKSLSTGSRRARVHRHTPREGHDKPLAPEIRSTGSGIVVSHKTGATAHVSPSYSAAFQAYLDDLEANGATIYFMGGYRRGVCSPRHMHPCGRALDVCQLARGSVDSRCHLPSRRAIAEIARRHGLFEGGQWCSSDYGHAQVGVSAAPCSGRAFYAAVEEFKQHR